MKKNILIVFTCLMAIITFQVQADELAEAEIFIGELKLSKDGTGIIKVRQCDAGDCKNILVKVTPETRGLLDGVVMSVLQAREQSKRGFVGLVYKRDSKKALTIGFTK